MITGVVIIGKAETGVIVCGPGPGILKSMVSEPGAALAAFIASRKVHSVASQVPVPGSAVEFTVNVRPAMGEADIGSGRAPAARAGNAARVESRLRSKKEIPRISEWYW